MGYSGRSLGRRGRCPVRSPCGGFFGISRGLVELNEARRGGVQLALVQSGGAFFRDLGGARFHPIVSLHQETLGLVVFPLSGDAAPKWLMTLYRCQASGLIRAVTSRHSRPVVSASAHSLRLEVGPEQLHCDDQRLEMVAAHRCLEVCHHAFEKRDRDLGLMVVAIRHGKHMDGHPV